MAGERENHLTETLLGQDRLGGLVVSVLDRRAERREVDGSIPGFVASKRTRIGTGWSFRCVERSLERLCSR